MTTRSLLLAVLGLCGLGACAQDVVIREVHAGPGGLVETENKAMSWMPGLGNSPGVENWRWVRVIAPQGATLCRSTAWMELRNPHEKAAPDANGVVMLTTRDGEDVHLECDAPGGKVRRDVKAVKWEWTGPGVSGTTLHDERWLVPPLVHMDATDPKGAERWVSLNAEICTEPQRPQRRLECRPGMMAKLQAADLGG